MPARTFTVIVEQAEPHGPFSVQIVEASKPELLGTFRCATMEAATDVLGTMIADHVKRHPIALFQ